jgi:lysozyme family protein
MNFSDAFKFVVGEEGGISLVPTDPGNWTGGQPGVGELRGTRYGVSAKAYPGLDIRDLTLEDAQDIAKHDYWDHFNGDALPYAVALVLFDEAYNAGLTEAIKCAQRTLRLAPDGILGGQTREKLTALTHNDEGEFAVAFTSYRIFAYTQMPGWTLNGLGWANRAVACLATGLCT